MRIALDVKTCLPEDGYTGTLIGRAWVPGNPAGPSVVVIRESGVFDLSAIAPTTTDLFEFPDPAETVRAARDLPLLGTTESILANTLSDNPNPGVPCFLAPSTCRASRPPA